MLLTAARCNRRLVRRREERRNRVDSALRTFIEDIYTETAIQTAIRDRSVRAATHPPDAGYIPGAARLHE